MDEKKLFDLFFSKQISVGNLSKRILRVYHLLMNISWSRLLKEGKRYFVNTIAVCIAVFFVAILYIY
ncbi:hypothetical protein D7322_07335 [Sphingobacterium puteale]|uniref:Uncharacterized protein n=1 Tax=Sphingobacterium puteale TaxID=2420510 RepID=A0A420W1X9_9SPHI|nr:hypothetical protein D7322_07335 [Sphingobacterium puteale]